MATPKRHFQFSMRRMFIAVACFATAVAVSSMIYRTRDDIEVALIVSFLGFPIVLTAGGAGIGALRGDIPFWATMGLLAAFFWPLYLLIAALVYWAAR
jgi:hypothetical protein